MFTVPKGKYYLGDPCYSLGGEAWGEILEACKYFEEPYKKGRLVAVAFSTGGDGYWEDQDGRGYSVDAGLLGLVPVRMATKKVKGDDDDDPYLVEFTEPTVCERDGDILKFGKYEINLNPEEEECCDSCGRPY